MWSKLFSRKRRPSKPKTAPRAARQGKSAPAPRTVRDSQRKKLYSWERLTIPHAYQKEAPRLTLMECQALVYRVWHEYEANLPAPCVKDGRGRKTAAAFGSSTIKLPRWTRMPEIVLHEIAHTLLAGYAQAHKVDFAPPWPGVCRRAHRPALPLH